MAYRVCFSPAERLGVVELTGTVRWTDAATILHTFFGHPDWAPGFDVLWDASAIAAVDISPEDLPAARGTMARHAAARMDGRSAIVTRSDAEAELAMLFSRLGSSSGRSVKVFGTTAGALAFLDREALPEDLPVIAASAPRAR